MGISGRSHGLGLALHQHCNPGGQNGDKCIPLLPCPFHGAQTLHPSRETTPSKGREEVSGVQGKRPAERGSWCPPGLAHLASCICSVFQITPATHQVGTKGHRSCPPAAGSSEGLRPSQKCASMGLQGSATTTCAAFPPDRHTAPSLPRTTLLVQARSLTELSEWRSAVPRSWSPKPQLTPQRSSKPDLIE